MSPLHLRAAIRHYAAYHEWTTRIVMQIVCPKCDAVLRKTEGIHRPGEPLARYEENEYIIVCPWCGNEHREEHRDDTSASSG